METFKNGNLKISVRNLVEFVLRSGDIDNRVVSGADKDAMQEGTRLHKKIQGKMGGNYHAEVPLRMEFPFDNYTITVEGRADGIIDGATERYIKKGKKTEKNDMADSETEDNCDNDKTAMIDEIKCMYADLAFIDEPKFIHKAQAMCYGYIYGTQNELETIKIQMTYVNIDTEEVKRFEEEFTLSYLKNWFNGVLDEYVKWADYMYVNQNLMRLTAKELEFPYEYRAGQREVAVSVYKAINRSVPLFIQAPTGVGKTMSTVFPAVKAMGEDKAEKLFYLTAKTIAGTVAHEAFRTLRRCGLKFKTIALTAKEKMCVKDEANCNPVYCERAKGHFDRINDAVYDMIMNESDITRELIQEYAAKHNVCPFEMSLDISNWVDGIICDYNYAFDPQASLKRYFAEGGNGRYIFLVDEAHNLVDRAREMYSAELCKEKVLEVKRIMTVRDRAIANALDRINKVMLMYKRQLDDREYLLLPSTAELEIQLMRFNSLMEKYLEKHKEFENRDIVLDFYFEALNYMATVDRLDECYEIYCKIDEDGNFRTHLMCINPSGNLKYCMQKAVSTIFFSATLLPVNYYKELLSGNKEDYAMYIDSPFDPANRLMVIGEDVTSRYTRRNKNEYEKLADYIYRLTTSKTGNYMVFFPSYSLLRAVYDVVLTQERYADIDVICQQNSMTEEAREEFLAQFDETGEKSMVAFCVMGGIFSEGIDLTNDRLIGTAVVGTGLPQVCAERDIIMSYFKDKGMDGFDYAYRFPGMNKVQQAAGRVIRTHEDMGVIALLDDRFLNREYTQLFPREWKDIKRVSLGTFTGEIERFWNDKNAGGEKC